MLNVDLSIEKVLQPTKHAYFTGTALDSLLSRALSGRTLLATESAPKGNKSADTGDEGKLGKKQINSVVSTGVVVGIGVNMAKSQQLVDSCLMEAISAFN